MIKKKNLFIPLGLVFLFTACSNIKTLQITPQNNIINKQSALEIRDIQIKTFDNTTKNDLINSIVDTLLDDGYFITLIDVNAAVISAKSKKDELELNFVSVIKEIKKDSFLVRFSINAVDLDYKNFEIVNDDLMYRYFFDRLRKSLFLEKNLYKKDETIEIKKPSIKETSIKEDEIKIKNIYTSPIILNNEIKTNFNKIGKYTLQFISAKDKKSALDVFNQLKSDNLDVRLESLRNYYVVRIGKFKKPEEAYGLLNKLKSKYKEVVMIKLK